ncbi:MAG: energy-coupling factor transporter transmembrane protein EcfT [Clostridiales bacterium]|nr:energy-coupling factor transporter transmembrane protein EcfT [Clostridiales bacterium]
MNGSVKGGAFAEYHPLVNFLYFALVIAFSMFFLHPLALGISLGGAFIYSCKLLGRRALRFNLLYLLPLLLVMAIMNPLFNHQGLTVLGYFKNGNPLTLESILYGLAAATMLVTVICWFSCYNAVVSSEKFLYLFGRVLPAFSLLLSMALRFLPRLSRQLAEVRNAQKGLGLYEEKGSMLKRARSALRSFSILLTWALEDGVETADSMRSRGYGLYGRTSFSVFRLSRRDKWALGGLMAAGCFIILGAFKGWFYYRYFPSLKGAGPGFPVALLGAAYAALCLLPLIIEFMEARKWKAPQRPLQ